MISEEFVLWVMGDAHVGTDLKSGRKSLEEALAQSEGRVEGYPQFRWDVALDVGDLSGSQTPPEDSEGFEVVKQYSDLRSHTREQIYNLAGNHDASGLGEPTQGWFQKYADPMGENTATSMVHPGRRPFPVEGSWERYRFSVGNILFLVMSDRNDSGPPVGRSLRGGYPAGAVSGETFEWWVDQVESNQEMIIVTAHHHMLKETTIGSGEWEGFHEKDRLGRRRSHYHGYFSDGGPMGAGYLYWVDGNPDAEAFERYLESHSGAIDLWLGGHTHAPAGSIKSGRSHVERRWDATFVNCAALSRHHVTVGSDVFPSASRVFSFVDGRKSVQVRCYLHTDDLADGGWYPQEDIHVPLRHAPRLSATP